MKLHENRPTTTLLFGVLVGVVLAFAAQAFGILLAGL